MFFLLLSSFIWAQEPTTTSAPNELAPVVISEKSDSDLRIKKDEINRVESLKPAKLEKKQAQTFAQLINNERGIDTQTSCAFCGAKRITINGLKGEHTTILVDGLPLHSTVSGFYGVEAIPLGGIDSIEIYRGAGAALTVPESIGGAINIVTKEIVSTGAETILSLANDGQKNISIMGTKKIGENSGFLLGVQYGEILPIDIDNNGISELPRQKTQSVITKFTHQLNDADDISFRLSYAELKTIGGTMTNLEVFSAPPLLAGSADFPNNDVRNRFSGDQAKITDNIRLNRLELASVYRKQLNADSHLKFSLGGARQNQNAIYSHGYDYDNRDQLWVAMLSYQRILNDSHVLELGLDSKNQIMDSSSQSLYVQRTPPLQEDDLNYSSLGAYAQDTWFINPENEMSLVLRYDRIKTHWVNLEKNLERSVLAPRLFYKHIHNPVLTSRFSAGLGYRSPMTLFESQHGTDHNGFVLDINELETAQSLTYSLAGQRQDDFFEAGAHVTRLEHMAYGVDQALIDAPTIFRNSKDPYTISVFDLSYGRRITHEWTLEGLFEVFDYPSGYKEKLPVAAIEKRFSLSSNIEWGKWTASQKIIVIGERNLTAYGYNRHYNIAYTSDDITDPVNFGQTVVQDQKRQTAPTYFTMDLNFTRSFGEASSFGLSVLNVFDYTQTRAGDSPTTWDLHGDHFHLDNFHIWGPLRGRQFFVNLKTIF